MRVVKAPKSGKSLSFRIWVSMHYEFFVLETDVRDEIMKCARRLCPAKVRLSKLSVSHVSHNNRDEESSPSSSLTVRRNTNVRCTPREPRLVHFGRFGPMKSVDEVLKAALISSPSIP